MKIMTAVALLALASCASQPTCTDLGGRQSEDSICFLSHYTEDRTILCQSAGGVFGVGLARGCHGFDVILYPMIDTGDFALYRPADGTLAGEGGWGINLPQATIDGVQQPFDLSSCTPAVSIDCDP